MTNNFISRIVVLLVLTAITTPFSSFSQKVYTGIKASSIFIDAKVVRKSQFSNLPSYISFKKGTEKDIDVIFPWLIKNLKLSNSIGFDLMRKESDKLGFTHYRYQQTYSNSPIEGAIWILHTKGDKVISMNGLIYSDLSNPGGISLNEEAALNSAIEFVGADKYKWELPEEEKHLKWESDNKSATYFPKAEKVYVSSDNNLNSTSYRLAYRFNIYAHSPLYRADVYVDASTGKVISENVIIHNIDTPGTAVTGYSGTRTITADNTGGSYRLQETGRGNGIRTLNMEEGTNYGNAVDFTDTDNNWNNANAQLDQYATDAHWGAEMTYDYFFNIHGRNSIDGNGFQLNSYVHYDNNFNNAFWDGQRMTYGDGTGSSPFQSLDVAGHEITHGLTTFTANLAYQAESGALNESFSDIFGASIENYARPTNWNWTLGEDLGSPFRSMSNPNAYGDPDTYFGNNWASLTGGDNGGVHTNSSVQNYWYYLLTDGGSGTNDNSNSYNITGIGFASSSSIAFRNLTVYLSANSQFSDARFFAIQSAMDLFGPCSPEVEQTTNAWYAVGVGAIYNPTVVAAFTAPVVSACSAPFTVNFTNQSNNAATFVWDFGDGTTSTLGSPSHTYTTTGTFNVQLTADGGICGNDVTIETAFIDIDPSNPCIITFPSSGNGDLQTACSGTIYDSGGSSSDYGPDQDAQITISPIGASTVDLNFVLFDIEPGTGTSCDYDYIDIYDGPNASSPLIGKYCNNNIPTTVSSTGSSITLVFHSDPGLEMAGYQIDWSCNLPTSPPIAEFNSDVLTSCTGTINFMDQSTNGPNSWSWSFGDGNTSTLQNPPHTYTANGTYTVVLTSSNANGSDINTKTNYIVINMPTSPSTTGDAICENNTASLSATGTNIINWYDAATNGNLITTGNSFTTPTLTSSTTYYVEEEVPAAIQYVGPTDNSIGSGGYFTGDQHLIFDCTTPFVLKSVWVDANGASSRTIELRDNVGTIIQSITVNVPDGQSRVVLNFDVPIGTNYQLGTLTGSSPNLFRNDSGPSFPYDIAGLVSITSSSAGGAYYYHFYDWEVQEYNCISARTPVTATVSPSADASITPTGPFCANDASVTLSAVDAGGTWSGIGVSGSTFNPTTAGSGNHIITYTITGACGAMDTETIAVSAAFNASISPTSSLCTGDAALNLTAVDIGGTWSGTGITSASNGTFDPAVAGIGTHTITYTIGGTCGDFDTEIITVTSTLDATISATSNMCESAAPINMVAATAGGTWSSTCSSCIDANGVFTPSVAGCGTYTVTYSLSGACSSTDTESVVVLCDADATISPVSNFCSNDAITTMNAVDAGGTWSGNGITGDLFNTAVAGPGTHTIIYTISGSCGATDSIEIVVNSSPDATITTPDTLCINGEAELLNSIEHGGTWTSSCGGCVNTSSEEFDPSIAGVGTHTIYYSITSLAACVDSSSATIFVDECTGINEEELFNINLYPNPVTEYFTIETNNLSSGIISITDLLGKEIFRTSINSNFTIINVGNILSKGNYFVRIFTDDKKAIAVRKLIKM